MAKVYDALKRVQEERSRGVEGDIPLRVRQAGESRVEPKKSRGWWRGGAEDEPSFDGELLPGGLETRLCRLERKVTILIAIGSLAVLLLLIR